MSAGKGTLYNPGKSACYWLEVDTYGKASTSGVAAGPQPMKEFYSFDSVNNWFKDNPESVKLNRKKGEKGKVQTALQRAKACMEFVKCPVAVREKLILCQRKAFDAENDSAFEACGDEAVASCEAAGGEEAPAAPSSQPSASASAKAPAPGKKK